jgi:tRNA (guanine10-N2)-dimethyltransferase
VLILLSGEPTSLPEAEARALVLAYDDGAEISKVEDRIIIVKTSADPDLIARRIAFARRVGLLIPDGELDSGQSRRLRNSSYRVRIFRTRENGSDSSEITSRLANQTDAKIDLRNPEFEISVIRGSKDYFALSRPNAMRQGWVSRRPRSRAFFHPAAIFPKLARALVNLTRVGEGGTLLDPYVGTGSLLIEGFCVGADCVGIDISRKMVKGSLANEKRLGQKWVGIVRADTFHLPVNSVDAMVTDVPYGRASSSEGTATASHLEGLVTSMKSILKLGGRAVIMHPNQVEIPPSANLNVEEEHQLYMHRRLTRTITVLRRT